MGILEDLETRSMERAPCKSLLLQFWLQISKAHYFIFQGRAPNHYRASVVWLLKICIWTFRSPFPTLLLLHKSRLQKVIPKGWYCSYKKLWIILKLRQYFANKIIFWLSESFLFWWISSLYGWSFNYLFWNWPCLIWFCPKWADETFEDILGSIFNMAVIISFVPFLIFGRPFPAIWELPPMGW